MPLSATPSHAQSACADDTFHVSILCLSNGRTDYLCECVQAVRRHGQQTEPAAKAVWICMDNASGGADREELRRLGWDLMVLAKENGGVGRGINYMLSAVRTPYFIFHYRGVTRSQCDPPRPRTPASCP